MCLTGMSQLCEDKCAVWVGLVPEDRRVCGCSKPVTTEGFENSVSGMKCRVMDKSDDY